MIRFNFAGHIMIMLIILLVGTGCISAAEPGPTATVTAVPPTNTPVPPTVAPPDVVEAEEEATAVPTPTETAVVPQAFQIVSEESTAQYRVEEEFFQGAVDRLGKELGFFEAIGTTNDFEGELQLLIEGTTITVEGGQFTVNLRTLKSDEARRDERIREQHLESDRFPLAEYTITGVEGLPETYIEGEEVTFQLIGDMTIREVTNEVIFTTTAVLQDDTITGSAFTEIMMVDFGFDPPEIVGFLKALDPARIEVEFTAKEQVP
mgnify:CR=1 FL=1